MGPGWGTGERGERARAAGLAARDGGGWGRARRLGCTRGAEVGEDRADSDPVLDGSDDAQPAATARAGLQVLPDDGVEHGVLGVAGLIRMVGMRHALG